jgi:hypothetical protein
MEKSKQILFKAPEYYLLIVMFFFLGSFLMSFNPVAWGIVIVLALQLIYKNKITGFLIGGAFLLVNLYMTLALLSEFSEFPTVNALALQLIVVGSCLIGLNILMAVLMLSKSLQTGESSTVS